VQPVLVRLPARRHPSVPAKEDDLKDAPAEFVTKDARGKDVVGYKFRMQISPLDCTGCGNCADICPAKEKALVMVPLAEEVDVEHRNWEFATKLPRPDVQINKTNVIGSQYAQPLFEFSGACAGCGETPYIKLITQLFGDRMLVANATGCSSIYGANTPTCPYTKNEKGWGPAWANSLFEDNAEFGYGMNLAIVHRRARLKETVRQALEIVSGDLKEISSPTGWRTPTTARSPRNARKALMAILPDAAAKATAARRKKLLDEILANAGLLIKKSIWIIGGDGWAYDIGYGGLDHVIAMGEDVNILVLDTEVYSNTGGQASKATPTGGVAKFAAAASAPRRRTWAPSR
jgi:pyruvate-ferredoxin/flavodoxin oxidoreductase